MSEFLLLYQPNGVQSTSVEGLFQKGCARLAQRCGAGQIPVVTTRRDDRLWTARATSVDSVASAIVTVKESWIATHGTLSIGGKAASERGFPKLLDELAHDPVSAARQLDGVFTVIAWSSSDGRLSVIPSALGLSPVFQRNLEHGVIALSSSLLTLAELGPVTLDEFSFQAMMRCGHRLPPNTLYREIRSIPEGALLEIDECGMQSRWFWKPSFGRPFPSRLNVCAEAISQHLQDYCRSHIDQSVPVFSDLTGGYDSRVTTAALVRSGISFVATVAGSGTHPDVIAARRIAAAEGIPLSVIDPQASPDGIQADVAEALHLSEGAVDAFSFAATLRVKRTLIQSAELPLVTTVSGALGECYRDFYWSQEFLNRGKRQPLSIDRLIRYRIDSSTAKMDIFASDWRDRWRSDLRAYIGEIVAPYSGERNTSQIDAVYLRKMAGMIGAFAGGAGRISAPLVPFGSLEALNLALSVPAEWRFDARLLRQVAWALNPKLANHMTLDGRPCAPVHLSNWHRFLPKYWMDLKRLARKFSTVWLGRTWFPEYAEPAFAHNPFAQLIEAETRQGGLLDLESMYTAQQYEPVSFRRFLKDARTPLGIPLCGLVGRIYTCEAMFRVSATDLGLSTDSVHGTTARR